MIMSEFHEKCMLMVVTIPYHAQIFDIDTKICLKEKTKGSVLDAWPLILYT